MPRPLRRRPGRVHQQGRLSRDVDREGCAPRCGATARDRRPAHARLHHLSHDSPGHAGVGHVSVGPGPGQPQDPQGPQGAGHGPGPQCPRSNAAPDPQAAFPHVERPDRVPTGAKVQLRISDHVIQPGPRRARTAKPTPRSRRPAPHGHPLPPAAAKSSPPQRPRRSGSPARRREPETARGARHPAKDWARMHASPQRRTRHLTTLPSGRADRQITHHSLGMPQTYLVLVPQRRASCESAHGPPDSIGRSRAAAAVATPSGWETESSSRAIRRGRRQGSGPGLRRPRRHDRRAFCMEMTQVIGVLPRSRPPGPDRECTSGSLEPQTGWAFSRAGAAALLLLPAIPPTGAVEAPQV
jgi:hypothetical protein